MVAEHEFRCPKGDDTDMSYDVWVQCQRPRQGGVLGPDVAYATRVKTVSVTCPNGHVLTVECPTEWIGPEEDA
jgi:hypothetical protein